MPTVSHEFSKENWEDFFGKFNGKKTEISIKPFYATSFDELIYGFKNNNLDAVYINAAIFLELKKYAKEKEDFNISELLVHQYSELESRNNRAVLLTTSDSEYISDTKNNRITFTDKKSMTGYIIPNTYLKSKMPKNTKIENWFSKIDYSLTKDQAVSNLIKKNKTDIIAIDSLTLKKIAENNQDYNSKCKILWRSQPLPENLFCMINFSKKKIDENIDTEASSDVKKKYNEKVADYMNVIRNFKDIVYKRNKEITKYNLLSKNLMVFEAVTNEYKDKLTKLDKYLSNNKQSQHNINILMQMETKNVK